MKDFKMNNLFEIFKKNFIFSPLLFFFFLVIITAGKGIMIVSSREPLANIKVTINASGENKGYFNPVAKLARAHNNTGMNLVNTSTWEIGGVFVERVALVIDASHLSKIKDVVVSIGEKDFRYTRNDLLEKWTDVTSSTFGYVGIGENNIILASPFTLSLETSKIPVKNVFFKSLINWKGDSYLTSNTLGLSIWPSLAISIWLFFVYVLYLFYFSIDTIAKVNLEKNEKHYDYQIIYLTLFFTIISEFVLAYIVNIFFQPDISNIIKQAKEIYLDSIIIAFIPKPIEQFQYLLCVLASPFFLLISYYLSNKLLKNLSKKIIAKINSFLALVTILGLPSLIYLGFSMSDFFYTKFSLTSSVFGFVAYSFVIFPLVVHLMINDKYQKILSLVLVVEFVILLVFTVFFNISSLAGNLDYYHFDPVYFPQTQIAHGKILIQQVPSLYGLFPLILKPIFDVIGIGVTKFTFVMCILVLICYLCLFYFLSSSIKRKIFSLLGIISVLGYSNFSHMFKDGIYNQYLQYLPIRMLFPSIILFLSVRYLKMPNRYLCALGHFIATLAIFWNFDSGVVVFISWNLFLLYLEIWKREDKKLVDIYKSICKHILIGIASLLLGLSLISFYYIFYSGSLPNINLFFQYSKMFYAGYFLIPLPIFPHIWYLVILVYLVSLLFSLIFLVKKSENIKGPLYFILSIIGLGLFAYFEGRSHSLTLVAPSFIVFLILPMFLDDLLIAFRNYAALGIKINVGLYFVIVALAYVLVLPVFDMVYNTKFFIYNTNRTVQDLTLPDNLDVAKNINFIKQHTIPGERILILAGAYDGMYYNETGTVCAIDLPSAIDLFFIYQFNRLLDYINSDQPIKVFVIKEYNNVQVLKILNSRFQKVIGDASIMLFIK